MLSTPVDGGDRRAAYGAKLRGRDAPAKRGVKECELTNGFPNDGFPQPTNGALYFGQLGHRFLGISG
jgi:hypothetical protein